MKTILLLFAFFASCTLIHAQLVEGEDGKFYDNKGQLYSGTYIEYFPSGNIHIDMPVDNGKKEGVTTIYFENGKKNETRGFRQNKMHGTWVTWDQLDHKIAEANYLDGVKHGAWGIWDENGIQRYEMFYDQGKKSGTWIIRNESGEIVDEKKY